MKEYIHLVQWIPTGEIVRAFKDPAKASKMVDDFDAQRTLKHRWQEAWTMKKIAYKVVKVEVM